MATGATAGDPLVTLREYRHLAPWSLRDLASLAAGILEAALVRPINAAASTRPSERTIRFYVARRLVTAPDGRGTSAVYSYRHLLEVLAVKLRQMEGATLAAIASELATMTGDVMERRVAAVLGPALPSPASLPLFAEDQQPRGRAGQLLGVPATLPARPAESHGRSTWHRVLVADGLELHMRDDHPLAGSGDLRTKMIDAVRLAAGRIISPTPKTGDLPGGSNGSDRAIGHPTNENRSET